MRLHSQIARVCVSEYFSQDFVCSLIYVHSCIQSCAGESRVWEDWEAPYYLTMAATVVILGVGLTAKPDTSLEGWAREEAQRRMAAEEADA